MLRRVASRRDGRIDLDEVIRFDGWHEDSLRSGLSNENTRKGCADRSRNPGSSGTSRLSAPSGIGPSSMRPPGRPHAAGYADSSGARRSSRSRSSRKLATLTRISARRNRAIAGSAQAEPPRRLSGGHAIAGEGRIATEPSYPLT
jgi:hypothetical protein